MRQNIITRTVPGTDVKIPVRSGPAGDLLIWAAARWHREIEPLVPGTCWGWAYRPIRGGGALSNHASGTAIDLNAPQHPLGTAPSANFTPAQIGTIRRLVADSKGCLRWGGDYTGRKDGMHLEVIKSESDCVAALRAVTRPTLPPPAPPATPGVTWNDFGGTMLPTLREGDGVKGGGDRGRLHWYVASVQALCNVRGLVGVPPLQVDGVFGPATTAAVKALQTRSGVPATGEVNAATWPWLLGNDAPDYA